nr:hypothetical protein [uncultured Bacteroides sp.]
MLKGIITGDIVHSTKIEIENRGILLTTLKNIVTEINENISPIEMEIFRGDSFQIVIPDVLNALKIALLIRSGLQKNTLETMKWDARVSLGIGKVEFEANSIVQSDGEAFHNSGRQFDEMGKAEKMALRTPWEGFNNEFTVSTAFADELISSWSIVQAEAIYYWLLKNVSQRELAEMLQKSPQTINKRLLTANYGLIELYLNRYQQLLKEHMEWK